MSVHRRSATRRLLALGAVVALAAPAITLSKRVAVSVDGAVHHLRTHAGTVGDLVAAQGIELAAGDRVLPAPHAELADGARIVVLRTITVDLAIDDEPVRRVKGTFRTVQGALAAAGITDVAGSIVQPGLRAQVTGGETITLRSPREIRVTVDGRTDRVRTHFTRLDLLLHDLGIALGAVDRIDPPLGTPVEEGMEVTIERVRFERVVEEVLLERPVEHRETDRLYRGRSRTVQEGEDGMRLDTYLVTVVDGRETQRLLASQEVVREPVARIVEEGTRQRPRVDQDSVWHRLARCESSGRWDYDGPSGYDGGLQFHPDTWARYAPAGYPQYAWQATVAQQIEVGRRVQAVQGWGAWPACSRKLGLR